MITEEEIESADEFHTIVDANSPCIVWKRDGVTHYGPGEGQFRVPVITFDAFVSRIYHAITTLNAHEFHTLATCPHVTHESEPQGQDGELASEYDADGFDAFGFDADGYDADDYNREGYDREGYNRDGYDREGYNDEGYDAAGYDREGYDSYGYNRAGYNSYGYDDEGYDEGGFDSEGFDREGYNRNGDRWCEECEHAPCVCSRNCCVSPQLKFSIRNDGHDPLAAGERATVTLPAGTITQTGMQEIMRYLQRQGHYDVSYDLYTIGDEWQSKRGNFTKRLSSHAYRRYGAKFTQEVLSQVGVIARQHAAKESVFEVDITRNLNLPAEEFHNSDSCWWGGYSESRCALKTNGGFGLRSFSGAYSRISGRTWVLPLKKVNRRLGPGYDLLPTFETMNPDAFVVFNGYGDLSGYTAPRILAHMAGWTYRKIGFEASPMYINAGGYLIAPEDIADKYTDGELTLSLRQHADLYEQERKEN